MNRATPRLLVLGGPYSGKSTYRAQLYQRVEHTDGELRLIKSVGDMTALEGDVGRLVQGLQPMHTNLDIYHSSTLLVADRSGRELALEFADYGGEQVQRIGENNSIPEAWIERVREASAWLFFLRIDQVRSTKSFMSHPVEAESKSAEGADLLQMDQSAEANAVETLQRLLFVRGASLRHRLQSPRFGVLLSCWDELPESERNKPIRTILEQRAPLFHQFIINNWEPDQIKLWGLSSTERKLPEIEPDFEFARKGPEHMGYVVSDCGRVSSDLTEPVSWLIQTV
jgi:hypothetical protein